MIYQIEIKHSARKAISTMPKDVQRRINIAIDSLKDNPRNTSSRKLTGYDNVYRLRIGDYRVIYEIHDTVLLILVVKVGHRREVYR